MAERVARRLTAAAAGTALGCTVAVLVGGLIWAPSGTPDPLTTLKPWIGVALLAGAVALAGFAVALRDLARLSRATRAEQTALEAQVAERTREMEFERSRAVVASRVKTRFLATMSHELRTPLNAVLGAAQLLHHTQLSPDQVHLVEAIGDNGTALLGLIENVLDVSRIEAGELVLTVQPFDLADCVEGALATTAVAARAKGLRIAAIVDPTMPGWRRGDMMRVRQILLNLLGNAVKFTSAGEVVLRAGPGAHENEVHISVRDTGIGLDASQAERIFEPFTQVDGDSTRRFAGSGLGLTITRELVEAMKGRIEVSGEAGVGTQFDLMIDLPLAPQPNNPNPRAGQKVAFFETHEPSAEAVGALLTRMGFDVQRVATGAELRGWLEQLPLLPDTGRPTVPYWVLVTTDDRSALQVLEAAAERIDPTRVIGMTSDVCYDSEQARETMGLSRSVIKPVLRSAVVSRMGAVESEVLPRSEPDRSDFETSGVPLILVVEDDPTNSMIVCSMLHNAGMAYAAAPDGQHALELIGSEAFDLVLMDWQMPDMDGLEVARRMRRGLAGPAAQTVPIVALTANAFAEDRNACLAAGMNDFLTKPVLASKLVETIRKWIGTTGTESERSAA